MMSINDATNTVVVMSKMLLDILVCIFKDINEIEENKKNAEELKKEIEKNPREFAGEELNAILRISETKLVHEPLGYVNVVCESPHCVDIEEEHIIYPQVCCKACRCSSFLMYFCSSISWLGKCKICGCSLRDHRWKTTKTTVVKEPVESEVIDVIFDSNKTLIAISKGIEKFKNRVEAYEGETQQMIQICAKLNAFAHQNTLLGATSTDDELLKCLENQRQTFAKCTATQREADYLAEVKLQYERLLSQEMGCGYSVSDVRNLMQQLYELPVKGEEIKRAVDQYEKSRREVIENGKKLRKMFSIPRAKSVIRFIAKLPSALWSMTSVPNDS